MTPKEAAELVLAPTTIGPSGRSLWEYLSGVSVVSVFADTDDRYLQPARVLRSWTTRGQAFLDLWTADLRWWSAPGRVQHDCYTEPVTTRAEWMMPDFTDKLTVEALYMLVQRAWTGRTIERRDHASGEVSLFIEPRARVVQESGIAFHIDKSYAVFARALVAAASKM